MTFFPKNLGPVYQAPYERTPQKEAAAIKIQHWFRQYQATLAEKHSAALERSIEITEELKQTITSQMPLILDRAEGINIISDANALVFQLPQYPQLVFILNSTIERRHQSLVKAKQICRAHNLDRLVIPHAKKFTVTHKEQDYTLLAEEKLPIDANEFYQEELYNTHSHKLTKALKQLSLYIAKTGFSDVNWRNIPLLAATSEAPQIALFDLEENLGAWIGFFGHKGHAGLKRLGLIGAAFTEEQIDLILAQAKENQVKDIYGFPLSEKETQTIKTTRLKEIEERRNLAAFYAAHKITGKEPITVDYQKLNLDLARSTRIVENHSMKTITLKDGLDDIVAYINNSIKKSTETTTKGIRTINILTSITMNLYERVYPSYVTPFSSSKEEENWYFQVSRYNDTKTDHNEKSWLERILDALIEGGYIFKVIREHGSGTLIQC